MADGARQAVERQVRELQEGRDQDDADRSNLHFAQDIMWGSSFGAIVDGHANGGTGMLAALNRSIASPREVPMHLANQDR